MRSGPRQPAPRAGRREITSAWPQSPLKTAQGTPPGDALPPPPQRATPACKSARSGAHITRARDTRATGPGCHARPQGRAAGSGTAPDTRRPSQRPPPGRPPATPAARSSPQGMQAKGTVPDPHTRTLAPTTRGQRTPTARPDGGQPGEDEHLTSHAPHNRARHPLRGRPPASPTARNAGSQERTLWGRCWVPDADTTLARDTRATGPGCPPPGTGGRERESAWRQTPLTTVKGQPRDGLLPSPPARSPPQGMQAKGTVPGSHARTPAPTARGQRTPAASPEGGQLGEDGRLTSDALHNCARHPPQGAPPLPTPQRGPHAHTTFARNTGATGPGSHARPQG